MIRDGVPSGTELTFKTLKDYIKEYKAIKRNVPPTSRQSDAAEVDMIASPSRRSTRPHSRPTPLSANCRTENLTEIPAELKDTTVLSAHAVELGARVRASWRRWGPRPWGPTRAFGAVS